MQGQSSIHVSRRPLTIAGAERRISTRRDRRVAAADVGWEARLPVISRPLLSLFSWYSRRYLRRHFHSLRVSLLGLPPCGLDLPTVIYSNHASWWDPLVGLLLRRKFFPEKNVYVPMEAASLERYGFFKRLGAFGIESGKPRGAAEFLGKSEAILRNATNVLWLTPQARFADARERPVRMKPGLAHLPRLAERICFLPVAIEYVFWEERLPEILVRFGHPYETSPADARIKPQVWMEFFAGQLGQAQDDLAGDALQRDPKIFRCLLQGRAGVGGVYDRWRAFGARMRGVDFQPQHGRL